MHVYKRTSLAALIIFAFITTAASLYYFSLTQKTTTSTSARSITSNETTKASSSVRMSTYKDSVYGFSVDYPCVAWCNESFVPESNQNAYILSQINIPVSENYSSVSFGVFTDDSVTKWNKDLEGPGLPFPLNLSSLRQVLKLPPGTECSVMDYWDKQTYDCKVINFHEMKAVEIINKNLKSSYPNRSYIINRNGNTWLDITEIYSGNLEYNFLADDSDISPMEQKELDAMKSVIDTIKFY